MSVVEIRNRLEFHEAARAAEYARYLEDLDKARLLVVAEHAIVIVDLIRRLAILNVNF